jgi:hypothetical protein
MRLCLLLSIILITFVYAEELPNSRKVEGADVSKKNITDENRKQTNDKLSKKYIQDLADRIKSYTVLPFQEISGNPPVEFSIELTSDGNLKGKPKLLRSSGYDLFDRAVQIAIEKSMPLPPNPATGEVPKSIYITQRPKTELYGDLDQISADKNRAKNVSESPKNSNEKPIAVNTEKRFPLRFTAKDKCSIPSSLIIPSDRYESGRSELSDTDFYCFGFDYLPKKNNKNNLPLCTLEDLTSKHCFAEIFFRNSQELYEGEYKGGEANGIGRKFIRDLRLKENQPDFYKKFEGLFKSNIMVEGKIFFHDQSFFEGKLIRETLTSRFISDNLYYGTRTYLDSSRYVGETFAGTPDGLGYIVTKNGKKTPGRFEDGIYVGTNKCDAFALNIDENNSNGKQIKSCTASSYGCSLEDGRCDMFSSTIWIKNKHTNTVKDLEIQCYQSARSGTVINKSTRTIYDLYEPEKIYVVKVKETAVSQAVSIDCFVVGWMGR